MRPTDHTAVALRLVSALGALMLSAACTASSPTAPSAASIDPANPSAVTSAAIGLEASLSFCTSEINRYRASVGLTALARSAELDAFSAAAVEYDHKARTPHAYHQRTSGGGGLSRAQNELLLWKGYAVNEVIRRGLADMWAQGPQGTHYRTMTGPYSHVGCGVFVSGSEVSVSQDFR